MQKNAEMPKEVVKGGSTKKGGKGKGY